MRRAYRLLGVKRLHCSRCGAEARWRRKLDGEKSLPYGWRIVEDPETGGWFPVCRSCLASGSDDR